MPTYEENTTSLRAAAALLPQEPGVYRFLNDQDEVIYVGKAKNLRRRVSSYFMEKADHPSKVRVMVRHISKIHHIVVASESDALLLENNIIKDLQPRYNILLKDDKTYPWIVVRAEHFPRVESTRRIARDGARYFGPYASVTRQKEILDLIHRLYPLRTCKLNLSPEMIARGRYSVCLEYHIGNCLGPCASLQSESDYDDSIESISAMLRGEWGRTRRGLEMRMNAAARQLRFEEAKELQQKLAALENYSSKSVIVNNALFTLDVFSLLMDDGIGYCNFVRIVSGRIVNSFTAEISLGADAGNDDRGSVLSQAILRMSEHITGELAHEIVVEYMPEEALFPGKAFTVPQRGDKLKLLEFSQRSAKLYRLEKLKNLEIKDPSKHTDRVMEDMRRELHLTVEPRHIECFDNSNLQGTNPVAACVVFRNGKPSKKEYRHFNVKTVVGADDFATMHEIIIRRYSRLVAEGEPLPDLIVVDGGKGQLSAAYSALCEMGLEDKIAIIGLAKRIEEVFFPNDPIPYYLDRNGIPLKVLMHIRDEAHRFGITFHRQKRSKSFIQSELESIPSLGPASIQKLLSHFRTMSAIRKASPEQLSEIVGTKRAQTITEHLHSPK